MQGKASRDKIPNRPQFGFPPFANREGRGTHSVDTLLEKARRKVGHPPEEDKGNVAVASIYGLVKCFGPKNCHASVDGSTLTALLSEPGLERQSGTNLFKGFDEMQAANKDHQMALK